MFPLPAKPRRLPERLFRHWRGIDENLDLRLVPRFGNKPPGQSFQTFLDEIMVVLVLRVDRYRPAIGHAMHSGRIMLGCVALAKNDHRPRLGPESRRVAAPMGPLREPAHLAVISFSKESCQPFGNLRHGIRAANPAEIEPDRLGLGHDPRLEIAFRSQGRHSARAAENPESGRRG